MGVLVRVRNTDFSQLDVEVLKCKGCCVILSMRPDIVLIGWHAVYSHEYPEPPGHYVRSNLRSCYTCTCMCTCMLHAWHCTCHVRYKVIRSWGTMTSLVTIIMPILCADSGPLPLHTQSNPSHVIIIITAKQEAPPWLARGNIHLHYG